MSQTGFPGRHHSKKMDHSMKEERRTAPFDLLIILDFEATCDEPETGVPLVNSNTSEIIEFPWLLFDPHTLQILDQQQYYVKPEVNPVLTPFCTKLTGISNETIKDALPLREVVQKFNEYVKETITAKGKSYCLLADGKWDLQWILPREAEDKGIELHSHFRVFYDLQDEFRKHKGSIHPSKRVHLQSMAEKVGVSVFGHHHSGIDDCKTVCAVLSELLKEGHVLAEPVNNGPDWVARRDYNNFYDFTSFQDPNTVNLQSVLRILEFDPEDVLNVYHFGPRVWGSDGQKELWQFIIVMKGIPLDAKFGVRRSNIRARVFSPKTFQNMIEAHDILVMCCLFLPEKHVWQEKMKIRPILELRKLRLSAVAACWKELKHTKFRWMKGEFARAIKSMLLGLRFLAYAVEMSLKGSIENFHEAVTAPPFVGEIARVEKESSQLLEKTRSEAILKKEVPPPDWAEVMAIYRELYENMVEALKSQMSKEKHELIDWLEKNTGGKQSGLEQLKFLLNQKDVDLKLPALHLIMRVLSIDVTRGKTTEGSITSNLFQFVASDAAPMEQPLVRVCNGLILQLPERLAATYRRPRDIVYEEQETKEKEEKKEEEKEIQVVCFPQERFFDEHSRWAPRIDWASTVAYEHIEGRTCTLYFYEGEWRVSSTLSPDGHEEVLISLNESNSPLQSEGIEVTTMKWGKRKLLVQKMCLKDLFWRIWNLHGWKVPSIDDGSKRCYMFELLLEEDIFRYKEQEKPEIVHHYGPPTLVLHGVRDLVTGQEVLPEDTATLYGWKCVDRVAIEGLSTAKSNKGDVIGIRAAKRAIAHLNPLRVKGLVLVDKNFNRIKIKALQYQPLCDLLVKVKKAKKKLGSQEEDEKVMLDVVRAANPETENMVKALNAHWVNLFNKNKNKRKEQNQDKLWDFYILVRDKYNLLCDRLQGLYDSMPLGQDGESRKQFAAEVKKQTAGDKKVLFGVKSGGYPSVRQYFAYADANSTAGELYPLYFPNQQQQQQQNQQNQKQQQKQKPQQKKAN